MTKVAEPVRAKIWELEALAVELERRRQTDGPRVVHCHGVFDLLHVGHLRYLQQARQAGSLLVVTVTPDRYVNKGPHRPAFNEQLRTEMLAALECVDYVAINPWPTACEAIARLRPSVYAKGAEYRDNPTPEMLEEHAAATEAGAEVAFIEDLTSSSSHLLNKYLNPFSDEVMHYLTEFAQRWQPGQLLRYLDGAAGLKVLVVGEVMIDEYHYCRSLGRSSSAPLVAALYVEQEEFAGGAAAVANHLAGICDQVDLLSFVGDQDDRGGWLAEHLKPNVRPTLLTKQNSPTLRKRRYRESYFGLPLFEVYYMNDEPLADGDEQSLIGQLAERAGEYDLVVMTDYGHGMMTPPAIRALCDGARFLALNTQANAGNSGMHTVSKYPWADFVCLQEAEVRLDSRSRTGELQPMLQDIAARMRAERVVVTRGRHGALSYRKSEGFCETPALATSVVDRVGAGDAFLSVAALAAVQGAPLPVLSFLGNVAGAEAVATVGHRRSLERLPLERHIGSLLK